MATFQKAIKTSPMWDESKVMLLGEIEHRSAIVRKKNGIPVTITLYKELAAYVPKWEIKQPIKAENIV